MFPGSVPAGPVPDRTGLWAIRPTPRKPTVTCCAPGVQAVIPERSDQKANRKRRGQKGGRPVGLDTEAYKRRNVVERSFNTFKQWLGLAPRYNKLALTYRGGVVLRAITIWLKELGDMP